MRYILSEMNDYKFLINFAKENRKNQTFAESIIWNEVRRSNLGCRFKRQVVAGKYIVDFICIEKIIIEIDGDSHIGKEEYDEMRTNYLNSLGFKVLRFSNDEVISNGEKAIECIKNEIA